MQNVERLTIYTKGYNTELNGRLIPHLPFKLETIRLPIFSVNLTERSNVIAVLSSFAPFPLGLN